MDLQINTKEDRMATKKKASTKKASSSSLPKFGSPAWRAKYNLPTKKKGK